MIFAKNFLVEVLTGSGTFSGCDDSSQVENLNENIQLRKES